MAIQSHKLNSDAAVYCPTNNYTPPHLSSPHYLPLYSPPPSSPISLPPPPAWPYNTHSLPRFPSSNYNLLPAAATTTTYYQNWYFILPSPSPQYPPVHYTNHDTTSTLYYHHHGNYTHLVPYTSFPTSSAIPPTAAVPPEPQQMFYPTYFITERSSHFSWKRSSSHARVSTGEIEIKENSLGGALDGSIVKIRNLSPPLPLKKKKKKPVRGFQYLTYRKSTVQSAEYSIRRVGFCKSRRLECLREESGKWRGERDGGVGSRRGLVWRKEKERVMPVRDDGKETTVMIRNIPNQYTRTMLVEFLDDFCDQKCLGKEEAEDHDDVAPIAYDFVYLPVDFGTNMNLGYAFVNFTTSKAPMKLHLWNQKDQSWKGFESSNKRREIAYAKIQGKEQLMKHFENSVFNCESEEYLPVVFIPARQGRECSTNHHTSTKQRQLGRRKCSKQDIDCISLALPLNPTATTNQ